jgi:hypothetical protein
MAPPSATLARLTGAGAVAATVVSAILSAEGPWEPASVILGWTAVGAMAAGVGFGMVGGVASAVVIQVVRLGIEAVAGGSAVETVLSTLLLVGAVEAASTSFEGRRMVLEPWGAMGRIALAALGAAVAAALVLMAVGRPPTQSVEWRVAAVAGAAAIVLLVMGAQRTGRP